MRLTCVPTLCGVAAISPCVTFAPTICGVQAEACAAMYEKQPVPSYASMKAHIKQTRDKQVVYTGARLPLHLTY